MWSASLIAVKTARWGESAINNAMDFDACEVSVMSVFKIRATQLLSIYKSVDVGNADKVLILVILCCLNTASKIADIGESYSIICVLQVEKQK